MSITLSKKNQFLLFLTISALFFAYIGGTFYQVNTATYIKNDHATVEIQRIKTPQFAKKSELVSILLTGDVMLGRSVMQKYVALEDFTYPFKKVADRLRKADLVFVNLENPVVTDCPIHTGGFKFCSPPDSVEGLLSAGVDIVTLANNHAENYGQEGLKETVKILGGRGILATGTGELVTLERKGLLFGFLGFDKAQESQPKLETSERQLIENSDKKVDILVVAMHWGVEYQNKALPGVRALARELVKAGADVVVGHHPHWVQDYEFIEGKPVYYSLGNFVFDQMWSEETKKGLVAELIYKDGEFFSSNVHPTYMFEVGQPVFSAAYLGE